MTKIIEKFNALKATPSDINEHLETLKRYTEKCDTVIEMGVRSIVSTWAFLAGNPQRLTSLDLYHPSVFGGNLEEVFSAAAEADIAFTFVKEDSLKYEIIDQCDLLFIDTWHDYLQLKQELFRHAPYVDEYIILHDTTSFGYDNELINDVHRVTNLPKGLMPAITEFLNDNKDWILWEKYAHNNGLTILKRIQ